MRGIPLTKPLQSRGVPLRIVPTLLTSLALSACGAETDGGAATDSPASSAAEARLPYEDKPPFLSPRGGPPGTEVTVTMSGLPLGAAIAVGFGTFVGHEVIGRGAAGADGTFSVQVAVPASAEPNRSHYFFLADSNELPIAVSNAFLVTRPDGTVRLQGEITGEGVECLAMRGPEDAFFSLVGEVGSLRTGARVTVEATLAEMSICQQGLTLDVRAVETRP